MARWYNVDGLTARRNGMVLIAEPICSIKGCTEYQYKETKCKEHSRVGVSKDKDKETE